MATKRSVKKSPSPKAPKATTKIADGLVSVDSLQVVPRRTRPSRFDPIARELIDAGDSKVAKIYNVPEGRDLAKHRSQVYVAMQKSLKKAAPKDAWTVTVRVLENRQFGISIAR